MGQIEMKCIFNIGKNISILAKVTQVSDLAHGPFVSMTSGMNPMFPSLMVFNGNSRYD
jgi:hypothetical protein